MVSYTKLLVHASHTYIYDMQIFLGTSSLSIYMYLPIQRITPLPYDMESFLSFRI